jgi:hypothetical protein
LRSPFKKEEKGSPYISFFRLAENKKHFIHFEHFYPSGTTKYYLDPPPLRDPLSKKYNLDPLSKENLDRDYDKFYYQNYVTHEQTTSSL